MAEQSNKIQSISESRIESHVQKLEKTRHPVTTPEALEWTANYIQSLFKILGYSIEEQTFEERDMTLRNIIATRQGTKEPEKRIIVIAHYDTVANCPGADDNASGVAVLIELATIFKSYKPERTIQFIAVSLEEADKDPSRLSKGMRGSTVLAKYAKRKDWEIEGVIVLESVGFASEFCTQKLPAGLSEMNIKTGNFIAAVGNQNSADLVEEFVNIIGKCRLTLPYLPLIVSGNGEEVPDIRRSDHVPFWDLGYKAIMLTDTCEFRNPNYHQPTDKVDTLNFNFMTKVCGAIAALLVKLS